MLLADSRSGSAQEQEAGERRRLEECGQTVLFFANHLGYIARQVIDRDELDTLIDNGISGQDLGSEIGRRITEAEGSVLGYQSFGQLQVLVKLTQDYRDRHLYVVGKSGSGKTNLLRNLILQDLEAGSGLGVILRKPRCWPRRFCPSSLSIGSMTWFTSIQSDTSCPVCFNSIRFTWKKTRTWTSKSMRT